MNGDVVLGDAVRNAIPIGVCPAAAPAFGGEDGRVDNGLVIQDRVLKRLSVAPGGGCRGKLRVPSVIPGGVPAEIDDTLKGVLVGRPMLVRRVRRIGRRNGELHKPEAQHKNQAFRHAFLRLIWVSCPSTAPDDSAGA